MKLKHILHIRQASAFRNERSCTKHLRTKSIKNWITAL